MKKILIIKYKNIGDILLSSALINELSNVFPDASFDYVTKDFCKDMIKNHPRVNMTMELNSISTLLELRKKKYDLAIALSEGDRTAITLFLAKAKLKIGFSPKNKMLNFVYNKHLKRDCPYHSSMVDMQMLTLLGYDDRNTVITSHWNKEDEKVVDEQLEKYDLKEFVIVHPVSRWMFKCWKDDYFAEVIDYIENKKKIKVVITASPDSIELKKVESILSRCISNPINLSGMLSLNSITYLYSKAKLYLGVDTAPMHIAASLNIPVIALFGPSEPRIWGPWDNIEQCDYEPIAKIQKTNLHTIMQDGFGEIVLDENDNKYSTSLYKIKPELVIKELDLRLA